METYDVIGALKNNAVLSFYGWWQCIVCLFAFVALMSRWFHIDLIQFEPLNIT